jgi:hypothetical protein
VGELETSSKRATRAGIDERKIGEMNLLKALDVKVKGAENGRRKRQISAESWENCSLQAGKIDGEKRKMDGLWEQKP